MSHRQYVLQQQESHSREATGTRAEILSALNDAASHLISLIQLERQGIYNTNGETRFWSGNKDLVLREAVRIVTLAERRAELKKDAPR
jgi:hypothetical protein